MNSLLSCQHSVDMMLSSDPRAPQQGPVSTSGPRPSGPPLYQDRLPVARREASTEGKSKAAELRWNLEAKPGPQVVEGAPGHQAMFPLKKHCIAPEGTHGGKGSCVSISTDDSRPTGRLTEREPDSRVWTACEGNNFQIYDLCTIADLSSWCFHVSCRCLSHIDRPVKPGCTVVYLNKVM